MSISSDIAHDSPGHSTRKRWQSFGEMAEIGEPPACPEPKVRGSGPGVRRVTSSLSGWKPRPDVDPISSPRQRRRSAITSDFSPRTLSINSLYLHLRRRRHPSLMKARARAVEQCSPMFTVCENRSRCAHSRSRWTAARACAHAPAVS